MYIFRYIKIFLCKKKNVNIKVFFCCQNLKQNIYCLQLTQPNLLWGKKKGRNLWVLCKIMNTDKTSPGRPSTHPLLPSTLLLTWGVSVEPWPSPTKRWFNFSSSNHCKDLTAKTNKIRPIHHGNLKPSRNIASQTYNIF